MNIFVFFYFSSLDVFYNFWGYDDEVVIKKRIFDVEVNYDYVLVVFKLFFSSLGKEVYGLNFISVFLFKDLLGGCFLFFVYFDLCYSFYKVVFDLIIMLYGLLMIDFGVEVFFYLGVGMLVFGLFFVNGIEIGFVKFFLLRNN